MTDQEMEAQMDAALEKIPGEIRKIKFILFFVKTFREIKRRLWR